MTAHLIALRPEPGLSATVAKAGEMGLAITGLPLSEIRALEWDCPEPDGIDGLLIGSANAILHGGPNIARVAGKPVYAVGEATAAAARSAGFTIAMTGSGGLQGVLDTIAAPCHLLRIAGEEHVPLVPPAGVTFAEVIAYRSAFLPLDPVRSALSQGGALVLLHSAATARHFAMECDRLGLVRRNIVLAALGPRIAAAAGTGWGAVHTATQPDEATLLQLVFDLCNAPRSIRPTPSEKP
ncbi:uroporphyrinogen-III synthase [Erythrobacter sp. R86502]|uniref:uroporphyrinogen-III synthase n=1 Tax=Erythrobacter sp. R86502 TaxID=3093846 RepID=UPI0036D2C3EB